MNIRLFLRAAIFTALIIGQLYSHAFAFSNDNRVIDDIGFSRSGDDSVIKISFNFRVRYLRHYPLNDGKVVRIQFEPILTNEEDFTRLRSRESFFPVADNPAGVLRVDYEGNDLPEPSILVVFNRPHKFDAMQGNDFRSLMVLSPIEKRAADRQGKMVSPTEKEAPSKPEPEKQPVEAIQSDESHEQWEQSLLDEGVRVMAEKNYSRAIQIYTKLLESKNPEILEMSQFKLALAREEIGHLAHARAEYRNYLKTFPDGSHAKEAQRRLSNLLDDRRIKPGGDRGASGGGNRTYKSEFYGSASLYYDRDEGYYEVEKEDEDGYSVTNMNSLTAGMDVTWRLRTDSFTLQTVGYGTFEKDLLDDRSDETRIGALYIDYENISDSINFRIGRQSSSKGGVLNHFDGARFGYRLFDKARLNLVAGFPVERSTDGFETEKYFYGLNVDLGTFIDHWALNTYLINQQNDGVDDRRAAGAEIRYSGSRGSFFTLLDYDILFNDLGILLFAGNYLLPNDQTRIHMSMDYRKSPLLSTSNSMIGQISPTLGDLVDSIGESAVRQLAVDRSLSSRYVTVGLSHPLTDNLQIAADISWSKIDGAPASGGVDALESTGDEYYGSLQLVGREFFNFDDLSTLSLRYSQTRRRNTSTLFFRTRFPIFGRWRISPKLQIDHRENRILAGKQWQYRPGMRLEYILSRLLRFELDFEYSYVDRILAGLALEKEGYSLSLGVRSNF